jgi:L-threonylcarbamoyladenylate synthase
MKIIKQAETDLEKFSDAMSDGKTIIYPTETCYGLGCDATNQDAVDAVFSIKQRQKDKPLLVVVSDLDQIIEYIEWTPALQTVSERYWPGALTAVVQVKADHPFAKGVVAEDGTLAFRVTAHPFVFELCETIQKPLVSTSANIAAHESPYDIESVKKMFGSAYAQPDLVIDAGTLPEQSPSTIVKIEGESLSVLRQGEVVVNV